jgi:hypothetical protein
VRVTGILELASGVLLLFFMCSLQIVLAGFFKEKTAKTLSPFEKGGAGGFKIQEAGASTPLGRLKRPKLEALAVLNF